MERVDVIIVGAGVVGLAVARAFALAGKDTLILEAEDHFGSATSSRNSEVVHAGLYYPKGSLKAATCVEGRDRLYAFCEARGVPYRRIGKIIFAADAAQTAGLRAIAASASDAGVADLIAMDRRDIKRREPVLDTEQALFSPSTGIVDSHAFMLALLGEAEAHGANLVCNVRVEAVERVGDCWQVRVAGEAAPVVETPILINAAGLGAPALARAIEALPAMMVPRQYLARGVYFTYSGKTPFSHLIYPVPEPGGLGTHLTLDLAGQARFGPDVEWIDAIDYGVDAGRAERFVAAGRKIWPALDPARLQPGYAGIRPKLSGPGDPPADFLLSGPDRHGLSGLVNLFGIESPGLTASLALADHVVAAVL